nr:MAG TPA: hypothetical protein [Caudoviricetes sp.]
MLHRVAYVLNIIITSSVADGGSAIQKHEKTLQIRCFSHIYKVLWKSC